MFQIKSSSRVAELKSQVVYYINKNQSNFISIIVLMARVKSDPLKKFVLHDFHGFAFS